MRNRIATFLFLIAACNSGRAQIISGTIVGTATDASGSVVANAKIAATNESTGVVRSTVTNAAGGFVLVWPENWIPMKMRYFATAARRPR
jgi:hypothetical protein